MFNEVKVDFGVRELDEQAALLVLRNKMGVIGTLSEMNVVNPKEGSTVYVRDPTVENMVICNGTIKVKWVSEFITRDKQAMDTISRYPQMGGCLVLSPVRGNKAAEYARQEGTEAEYVRAGMIPKEAHHFYCAPYDYKLEQYPTSAFILQLFRKEDIEPWEILLVAAIVNHPVWSTANAKDKRLLEVAVKGKPYIPQEPSRFEMSEYYGTAPGAALKEFLEEHLYRYSWHREAAFIGNLKVVFQRMRYDPVAWYNEKQIY